MNYFLAVNDRQLGTCLRMLFAEGIQGIVQVVLNDKNKIEFHISIAADDNLLESLKERYTISNFVSYSISKVKGPDKPFYFYAFCDKIYL